MEYNIDQEKGLLFSEHTDLYGIELKDTQLENIVSPVNYGGLLWMDMAVDYEKYAKVINLTADYLEIEQQGKEAEAVQEISENVTECANKMLEINNNAKNLVELIDGVKVNNSGIDFNNIKINSTFLKKLSPFETTANNMNISNDAVFQAVKNYTQNPIIKIENSLDHVSVQYHKSISENIKTVISEIEEFNQCGNNILELMNKIENQVIDLNTEIDRLNQTMETLTDVINGETLEGIAEDINSLKNYNIVLTEDICDVQGIKQQIEQNMEITQEVQGRLEILDITEDLEKTEKELINAKKRLSEISYTKMSINYQHLESQQEDRGILKSLSEFLETGILSLVIPEGEAVSECELTETDLASSVCSKEEADTILAKTTQAVKLEKNIIYGEYILDHFSSFIDKENNSNLNYEVEYILGGNNLDSENLLEVTMKIATIRSGINMLYLITDTSKKQQAYELAALMVGATGIEPLIRILQYALLYLWAFAEGIADVKLLLEGEKILLNKTEDTWQLSFENLLAHNISTKKQEESKGLGYEDYLRILLYMEHESDKASYTMDLVELFLSEQKKEKVRMKNYIYGLEAKVEYRINGYTETLDAKVGYSY